MDELDILLEELQKTSVSDRAAAAVNDYDSLFQYLTPNSSGTTGLTPCTELNSQGPGSNDVGSSLTVPLIQPVYSSQLAVPGGINTEGTEKSEYHVYSEVPDVVEAMLSPTSAVQQLDDILSSLMDLPSQNPSHAVSPCPQPVKVLQTSPTKSDNSLDKMLGSLETDLKLLGVSTVAKGACGSCNKPIVGKIVTAMGRTWHPEHFVCFHCSQEIGSKGFFERDGHPFCHKDYHNLFSPRCAYCSGPILDKILTAMDKTWHPEHFFCAQCGEVFGTDGHHERNGKPYCAKDFFNMFAPKCGSCDHPVMTKYLSALNNVWHPECFVCRDCHVSFESGSFFEVEGMPYCDRHYYERQGMMCAGCQKPITGRCVAALGKKFHLEHFVCAFCLKQLSNGIFVEKNNKPYCNACLNKLFV